MSDEKIDRLRDAQRAVTAADRKLAEAIHSRNRLMAESGLGARLLARTTGLSVPRCSQILEEERER